MRANPTNLPAIAHRNSVSAETAFLGSRTFSMGLEDEENPPIPARGEADTFCRTQVMADCTVESRLDSVVRRPLSPARPNSNASCLRRFFTGVSKTCRGCLGGLHYDTLRRAVQCTGTRSAWRFFRILDLQSSILALRLPLASLAGRTVTGSGLSLGTAALSGELYRSVRRGSEDGATREAVDGRRFEAEAIAWRGARTFQKRCCVSRRGRG